MDELKTYVLCEFPNEGPSDQRPVQIGFSEWINFPPNTNLTEIIEKGTTVQMKWPNCDVKPREKWRSSSKIEWKNVVAVPKAQNPDWPTLADTLKSLIKDEVVSLQKHARKERAKIPPPPASMPPTSAASRKRNRAGNSRQVTDFKVDVDRKPNENIDSSSSDDEHLPLSKVAANRTIKNKNKKKKKKKKVEKVVSSSSSDENDDVVDSVKDVTVYDTHAKKKKTEGCKNAVSASSELIPSSSQTLGKKGKKHEQSKDSSSETCESDSEEETDGSGIESADLKLNRLELINKVSNYRTHNKELRQEVARLRAMEAISTKLPQLVNMVDKLLDKCKKSKGKGKKTANGHEHHKSNYGTEDSAVAFVDSPEPTTDNFADYDIDESKDILKENYLPEAKGPGAPSPAPIPLSDAAARSSAPLPAPIPLSDAAARSNVKLESSENSGENIYFGSKSVPSSQLQSLRHKKVTILAAELTALVFTPEEMALSTLKGRKSNAHFNAFQKRPLDEERVTAIIRYVAKHFGKKEAEISEEVKKGMTNKLNNFSTKTEEGKEIVRRHRQSLGLPTLPPPPPPSQEPKAPATAVGGEQPHPNSSQEPQPEEQQQ